MKWLVYLPHSALAEGNVIWLRTQWRAFQYSRQEETRALTTLFRSWLDKKILQRCFTDDRGASDPGEPGSKSHQSPETGARRCWLHNQTATLQMRQCSGCEDANVCTILKWRSRSNGGSYQRGCIPACLNEFSQRSCHLKHKELGTCGCHNTGRKE